MTRRSKEFKENTMKRMKLMNRGSINFLRAAILLIGLIVLAICALILPNFYTVDGTLANRIMILATGMYAAAVPFYVALYQGWKILGYIERNKAFSGHTVEALRYIKYSGITISVIYAALMPIIYQLANFDDAPGVLGLGLIFAGGSFVVAVAAAVLQNLLQNAIEIKSENDLTV
jgi:hypothetical protein